LRRSSTDLADLTLPSGSTIREDLHQSASICGVLCFSWIYHAEETDAGLMRKEHSTFSEQETLELAQSFAQHLERGDVVALWGELGTGKTRFVKGVCKAFGVNHHVSSPSFVILNRYEGKDRKKRELFVYHLDLYRVRSVEEIYDLGYEEFIYGEGITLIEWAEQLGDLLPSRRFDVHLRYGEQSSERRITIERVEKATPPREKPTTSSSV
jgi:tRNA threonylcarbamoyladenosine biosynthesis protein TsaE